MSRATEAASALCPAGYTDHQPEAPELTAANLEALMAAVRGTKPDPLVAQWLLQKLGAEHHRRRCRPRYILQPAGAGAWTVGRHPHQALYEPGTGFFTIAHDLIENPQRVLEAPEEESRRNSLCNQRKAAVEFLLDVAGCPELAELFDSIKITKQGIYLPGPLPIEVITTPRVSGT